MAIAITTENNQLAITAGSFSLRTQEFHFFPSEETFIPDKEIIFHCFCCSSDEEMPSAIFSFSKKFQEGERFFLNHEKRKFLFDFSFFMNQSENSVEKRKSLRHKKKFHDF